MTVQEFITNYKIDKDVMKHVKTKYIPYLKKVAVCQKIVKTTSYVDDKFMIDTPARIMFGLLSKVKLYTDIDVDFSKADEEFDALTESGMMDKIMGCIPDEEIARFNAILTMVADDFMINERSVTSYLDHKIGTLTQSLGSIEEASN